MTQLKYSTGAVRSSDAEHTRFDLIPQAGVRRLAETCAEGAQKYGERNWEQGFPASSLANHALRHINLWLSGNAEEDHLSHAAWNLLALMHFEEEMPEMIDVPTRPDRTRPPFRVVGFADDADRE
jgi:dATP/dGTP diphosphohydrolase, N-terminal